MPSSKQPRIWTLTLALIGAVLVATAAPAVAATPPTDPPPALLSQRSLAERVRVSKAGRDLYELRYSGIAGDDRQQVEKFLALQAARLALAKGASHFSLVPDGAWGADASGGHDPARRYSFRMGMWRVVWGDDPRKADGSSKMAPVIARVTVRMSASRYDGVDPLGFDAWALKDYLEQQFAP